MTVDLRELHPVAQVAFIICVTVAIIAFCHFVYKVMTDGH